MSVHGTFCWYEFVTPDVAEARRFYGEVVGWTARDAGHPDVAYTLFEADEQPVAGLMVPPPEAGTIERPFWLGFVAVDDVDASAAAAAKLGGSLHRAPTDISGIGRFAVVADPHGAVIVLFRGTAQAPDAALPAARAGCFGWSELMAGDLDSAFSFYETLFGWTRANAVDMGPMGTYQLFAVNGQSIGGMMTKPAALPAPPHWRYYINVDDIDAAAQRVAAAGGTVTGGPHPVPGGSWVVQAQDPAGGVFALVSARR